MRITPYSDIHLEHKEFEPPTELDADVVVLAGDVHTKGRAPAWARSRFIDHPDRANRASPPVVIYVCGNHEFYGSNLRHMQARIRRKSNEHGIRFLECEETVIRDEAKKQNVRFLGTTLWTGFSLHGARDVAMDLAARKLNDYLRIKSWRESDQTDDPWLGGGGRLTPAQTLRLHQASVQWLSRKLDEKFDDPTVTVVVTHHAPHRLSLPEELRDDELSPAYATDLTRLIEERGPQLWIHGHVHSRSDYVVGPTRIVANPRGYVGKEAEPTGFDPRLVIEI